MNTLPNVDTIYQEILQYLYSFVDLSLTRNYQYTPEHFNLDRMREFARVIGNPHQAYPIIHVAGTKGKGSTCVFCAAALQAAGYRVGLYTSPHLHDYTERIQINSQPISRSDFIDFVEEFKPYLDAGRQLTTFEITTGMAMLYFARQKVDAAVIEVGLGGRLDSTNIVRPQVSVITSLSYDHMHILGNTLEKIAGEKAGIIKAGVPVVMAPQKEEASRVIEQVATERNAPLVKVGKDYLYTQVSHSLTGGQTMLVWPATQQNLVDEYLESGGNAAWEPTHLNLSLLGYHQVENAATAYAALQTWREQGFPVSEAAIQAGFSQASWPARFEILQNNPPVVIDSAHNRDSALRLCLALGDYFSGVPIILVFGASEDKDVEGMFAELMPRVSRVIATRSYHPRAMEPEKIVELAHRHGRPAKATGSIEEALPEAIRLAQGRELVLVTGSLFVAAGAREVWRLMGGV